MGFERKYSRRTLTMFVGVWQLLSDVDNGVLQLSQT